MYRPPFIYLYGSPEEVRIGKTTRSLSNIDSPTVREAVLLPHRQSHQSNLVIGIFQQYSYKHAPEKFQAQLET